MHPLLELPEGMAPASFALLEAALAELGGVVGNNKAEPLVDWAATSDCSVWIPFPLQYLPSFFSEDLKNHSLCQNEIGLNAHQGSNDPESYFCWNLCC